MGFVPATNVMKCELVFYREGDFFENTLYFKKNAAIVGSDFDLMGDFLRDWWTGYMDSLISSSVSLNKILLADLTLENGIGYEYRDSLPANGQAVGNPLPANCAIAVKFSTGYRGRSYRGRNYIGGLLDTAADSSVIVTAVGQDIVDAYALFIENATISDFTWSVVSRIGNGVERSQAVVTPVLTVSVDPVMDSQRRRLPGRGR
jgi:hypothetical protein